MFVEIQLGSSHFPYLTLLGCMPPDQNAFHHGPLPKETSLPQQAHIELSKPSVSNCEHGDTRLSLSFRKKQVLQDSSEVGMVNDQKMSDPDDLSSRVSSKKKLASLICD